MNSSQHLLLPALIAGTLALALPAAHGGSSASSAASDSVSVSVGSLSGSVQQSSQSSTSDRQVADGDYRVIEVVAIEGEPVQVLLRLEPAQARADAAGFALKLPLGLVQQHGGLVVGATLGARNRPYGLEFSAGAPRQAFFLALSDGWYDDMRSVPVTL